MPDTDDQEIKDIDKWTLYVNDPKVTPIRVRRISERNPWTSFFPTSVWSSEYIATFKAVI